ncbi:ABC transporter ATP-binding protein [Desulfosoma caldarium]|uniref:Iron complex transport system ATP-binding protein n=1 Tax=Desulfosoma caldarium TaxID=610254 RepID=A0A3N1VSI2_9BACT|nr:ABC transporter ATP-binding protein [Desulfosoma caldarium]ROR03182.1 iron complex transport system ATP-binding protein [Desulfosoma caldarium]
MIEVEHLHCGYPDRKVLQDVTLTIEPGEFVGILGPNGSGKTTLVLALSGVLPIQSGSIRWNGRPLQTIPHRERARLMAVVPQDVHVTFPFTCREVVAMGRYPHQKRAGRETPQDRDALHRAMAWTDTEALAERPVTLLSGGERQRVFVAKALAQDTPVLLLDEAVSAMDVHRKLQIFDLLTSLQHKEKRTIVFVLHDINTAAVFCRRLVFLKAGRIVADGPTDHVLQPKVLEDVYETSALVYPVPGRDGVRQVFFTRPMAGLTTDAAMLGSCGVIPACVQRSQIRTVKA